MNSQEIFQLNTREILVLLRFHAGPALLDTQKGCISLQSKAWLYNSFRLVECGHVSLQSGGIEEWWWASMLLFFPVIVEVLAEIEVA